MLSNTRQIILESMEAVDEKTWTCSVRINGVPCEGQFNIRKEGIMDVMSLKPLAFLKAIGLGQAQVNLAKLFWRAFYGEALALPLDLLSLNLQQRVRGSAAESSGLKA